MLEKNLSPNPQHPRPKTLITGGAGFLGSHLCDRLIAEGHQVICIDNLLTGRKKNIAHLLENENFIFIEHDVSKPLDLDVLMSRTQRPSPNTQGLNYILHFACPASPKDYLRHPIETMKVEAFGTHNMLELARETDSVFLLASTSEVYGDAEVNPQPEEYWGHVNPIGPRSVYDEAKRYAEALTMAYHRKYGLDIRIARIFNTYGPRMKADDGRVVSNFIVQALKGAPITVYGDGSQTRSFCYVNDLIEGIYRLLLWQPDSVIDKPESHNSAHITHNSIPSTQHPKPSTQDLTPVFNLGNPDEITILGFAKETIEFTGSKADIVFEPLPQDDPKVRRPDMNKAKEVLTWEPKVARREGLRKTIDYFKNEYEHSSKDC